MKRKLLITLLLLVATIACALAFTACSSGVNGTYYKVKYDGTLDESLYFKLNGNNWEDDDGAKGTFKTDENKIRLYIELFGEKEVLAEGTVENGVLSIDVGSGMKEVYITKDHGHKYGEWKTVSIATCTVDGIKTRTCACGVTERNITPSLGHSGEWTITKEATCTEEGSKNTYCTVCQQDVTEVIENLPHNYDSKYSFDYDNHWKSCIACGDKTEIGEHTGEGTCNTCGTPLNDSDGLQMTLNSDNTGYTVTGKGSVNDKFIRIPKTYEGLPVTSISNSAFYGCSSLTSITIPDSVTSIGKYAFYHCSSLTSIKIPDGVTSIGEYTFNDCYSLTSITIPDSVTFIGEGAFYDCYSLTSIKIPDGVTSISEYAFCGCSSLTNIKIPDGVTSIGAGAFSDCDNIIQSENGVLYVGKWVIGCDTSVTQVALRSNTIGIANYAFNSCALTSIIIPDSVTSIGEGAFHWCSSLISITIPDSVTFIGEGAFICCHSLSSVTIGNRVASIGYWTFYECTSLTSIIIPNSVTYIDVAFQDCYSLKSITIPNSVTYIYDGAFYNCNSLESITFKGSIEQWSAITKGNFDLTYTAGDYTIFCTDGTIAKDGTITIN